MANLPYCGWAASGHNTPTFGTCRGVPPSVQTQHRQQAAKSLQKNGVASNSVKGHGIHSLTNTTCHAREHRRAALPGTDSCTCMPRAGDHPAPPSVAWVGLAAPSWRLERMQHTQAAQWVLGGKKNQGTNKCTDSGTIQSHSDL